MIHDATLSFFRWYCRERTCCCWRHSLPCNRDFVGIWLCSAEIFSTYLHQSRADFPVILAAQLLFVFFVRREEFAFFIFFHNRVFTEFCRTCRSPKRIVGCQSGIFWGASGDSVLQKDWKSGWTKRSLILFCPALMQLGRENLCAAKNTGDGIKERYDKEKSV